jgi:hypothetical protein
MGSALAQRLAVGLAGSPHVLPGNRRERDELDRIDFDLTGPDPVATAQLDPRLLPKRRTVDSEGPDFSARRRLPRAWRCWMREKSRFVGRGWTSTRDWQP